MMPVSLDGYIEGPDGQMGGEAADDGDAWKEAFEMLETVDVCVLGRVMYPEYERYWMSVLVKAGGDKDEIAYARWADKTPHVVLSKTLDTVAWKTTRIVRDIDEIRRIKGLPGRDIYVVGGPTLIASLMNAGLIDELRLTLHPLVLGGGKALFKDVKQRQLLKLTRAKPLESGKVRLTYEIRS